MGARRAQGHRGGFLTLSPHPHPHPKPRPSTLTLTPRPQPSPSTLKVVHIPSSFGIFRYDDNVRFVKEQARPPASSRLRPFPALFPRHIDPRASSRTAGAARLPAPRLFPPSEQVLPAIEARRSEVVQSHGEEWMANLKLTVSNLYYLSTNNN